MATSIFSSSLGRFRLVSFVEGLSFLFLLGIAMPLKYIWQLPQAVEVAGMVHGVLFIAYCFLLLMVTIDRKWSFGKAVLLFLISLVPFGFLLAEAKFLKKDAKSAAA
jgi:integral membrane protein